MPDSKRTSRIAGGVEVPRVSREPLIEMAGVVKTYAGEQPLRVNRLQLDERDRVVVGGLDAQAAEMFIHLVCGALLPDEGTIRIAGVATSEIVTDQEWLTSLDRFGLVSHRAVLIESLSVMANLVLPLTLSIDPIPAPARAEAEGVARHVGLAADRLAVPVSELTAEERLRLHLGRALVPRPRMLLLEHPVQTLTSEEACASFGRVLADVSTARDIGFVAVSNAEAFVKASRGRRLRVGATTGEMTEDRGWWPWRRS
jgi:ABC-type ATPase involved in cell division